MYILLILVALLWAMPVEAQVAKTIYLAPVDGSGTDADPFRARGRDQNTGCIDLRPDPTKGTGWYICGRATLPAGTGYINLASRTDAILNAAQKTAIENNLLSGATLTASDIPSILAELLIDKSALTGKQLKPGRDGKYHIWLGDQQEVFKATRVAYDLFHLKDNGLLADLYNATLEPAVAWATTLATETFNCADNASLTCVHTWTEFNNTIWAIASNVAAASASGVYQAAARNDSTLATDDHDVTATLTAMTRTGNGTVRCGPIGRKDNGATNTYYWFAANLNNTDDQYETASRIAGTFASIATNTQNPAVGTDVIKLRVDGSSIYGYVNGVLVVGPTTDANITGNTYTGIAHSSNAATSGSCSLDNVIGADYAVANNRPQAAIILP